MRLRSGDVIGLSAAGPEFCFRFEAGGREALPSVAATQAAPQTTKALPPAPAAATAERQVVEVGDAPTPASLVTPSSRQWSKSAIGGLAACILLMLLWRVLQPSASIVPPKLSQNPSEPSSKLRLDAAADLPRDAVFLLQVEKAGGLWPFATCVAVDKGDAPDKCAGGDVSRRVAPEGRIQVMGC